MTERPEQRVALITGASQGLGRALAEALADRGWALVIDARRADRLEAAAAELADRTTVVGDPRRRHRRRTTGPSSSPRWSDLGRLDLLVNNASTLGASPLPRSRHDRPRRVPTHLRGERRRSARADPAPARPCSTSQRGTIVNITSDAAVEAYEQWGGYGSSKAALEHLSAVLAAEQPELRVLVVDPGDMRTEMHQDAFPGEDISDRPLADAVVPGISSRCIESDRPSGRYRLPELAS